MSNTSDERPYHERRVVNKMTKEELARVERIERSVLDLTIMLQNHLQDEQELQPKLHQLLDILTQTRGVVTFFKCIIYIGAPFTAFFLWIKDHFKF